LIFVTVGTQKFPFDRLIKKLDELVEQNIVKEEIIVQSGYSNYQPKNFDCYKILDGNEVSKLYNNARIIISHAGTSSIIQGLKLNKKIIVVPREQKFGEHVDDHQLEIAKMFEKRNLVFSLYDIDLLDRAIDIVSNKDFESYQFENKGLLNSIEKYLLDNMT
jgi:UDP-N-acetylglucosamine transferase subunit ALG13